MRWQQLISVLFGVLAIVYGWVQVKEHNNSIFVFVIWTLTMVVATGLLFYHFKNKERDNRAKK
jgi:uncharacterized membrane protein YhhN